jgi:hypothetical protein
MSAKDDTPGSEFPELQHSVGYGSPPKATQFKKGVSGNPKGRPKGSLNVDTLLIKALREKVVINEHGKRKKVTKLEAALKQLVNKAASGDPRAQRQLFELAKDAEAKQSAQATPESVISDRDQEVMDGILKRLLNTKEGQREQQKEIREGNNGDNERG